MALPNIVEVLTPSSSNYEQGGGLENRENRKRRFVISQHPVSDQFTTITLSSVHSEVKTVQNNINTLCGRISSMESKMSLLLDKCTEIVEKISSLEQHVVPTGPPKDGSKSVLFNNKLVSRSREGLPGEVVSVVPLSPSPDHQQQKIFTETSQIIKLNSESDFPDGSWLGDPENSEERVRVGLARSDLDNINLSCPSPEKMALALLEHLFSRETLAQSNLTGKGKHKKKQLDPLTIFGIFCHLRYRFDIDEASWVRIKNNMEAKCRFLWTRRSRGLPLGTGGGGRVTGKTETSTEQIPEFSTCPIYWGGGGAGEPRVITEYQLYDDKLLAGTVLVSAGANLMLGGGEQTQELAVEEEEEEETDNSIT